ncbi:P22 phage major capsid protein family protein [Roseateles sp. P5_E11]
MANTNKVIDMVAKEALRIAHEKATFISTINRDYDDSFAKTGAKIGASLRVRDPNQYTRRQGSRVMDVQDQNESTQTITVATQDGVDMRFNSAELTLEVDNPSAVDAFSKRYIEPAMSVMISGIDGDCLVQATKDTYNFVGTAGTVVGASGDITALGNARAKLNQGLAPKDMNRALQLDSVTMASIVNGNKALFAPESQIKKAFTEGYYGRSAMADFYENERTWSLTNGSDITGTTDAAALVTDGGNTVDMHTTVAVSAQVVGQVFTIAGVYACHPETKQSYGVLQQFTITAIGASTTTVSPAIVLTGPKKNVVSSTSGTLLTTDFNSQTLTFYGAASTSYRSNLMYHQDAFTFVSADLPLMDDAAKCVRKTLDGLSVRVWMASDIRNDELLMRIDMLYGFKTLRPAWACRINN